MEFFHSSSRKVTKTVSIIILGTLSAKTFFQYGFSVFFCLCLSLCDVYVHAYVCEHTHVWGGRGVSSSVSLSFGVHIKQTFSHFILS